MTAPAPITSLQNSHVKRLVRLRNRRERDREGVILIEPDQTITYANEAALEMHGVTNLDELGLPLAQLLETAVLSRFGRAAGQR